MPRKTDGMLFELNPRPTKGADGKPLLYARPAKGLRMTIKQIDDYCAKYRHRQRGEMELMFETFIEVVRERLAEGYRIETPLGSFAPKIRLKGEYTDPDEVKGRDVEFAGIEFIAAKAFVKEVGRRQRGFRKSDEQVGNAQMYDPQAMEEALKQSLHNYYTTIKTFQIYSGLKYTSAKNYLDSLCKGDDPRFYTYKEGNCRHYALRKKFRE